VFQCNDEVRPFAEEDREGPGWAKDQQEKMTKQHPLPEAGDLDAIRNKLANDRFAAANGMQLIELRMGYAKMCLSVENRHLNSMGTVHGGAIFSLADSAFGAATKTCGKVAPAISGNISFFKATRSGMLYAEAIEVSRSRKLSIYTVRVTNEAGELVALFQGTAYITNEAYLSET
jgi:acyl-CoA thioesterase